MSHTFGGVKCNLINTSIVRLYSSAAVVVVVGIWVHIPNDNDTTFHHHVVLYAYCACLSLFKMFISQPIKHTF